MFVAAWRLVQSGMFARIPSHYSPELEDVIKQLLSQDPRRRPSADALLSRTSVMLKREQLSAVLDGTLKAAIADEVADFWLRFCAASGLSTRGDTYWFIPTGS